jgi:hypothetical protein
MIIPTRPDPDKPPGTRVYQDPGEVGPYHPDPEPAVQVGDDLILEADLPAHPDLGPGPYHHGPDGTPHYPDAGGVQ